MKSIINKIGETFTDKESVTGYFTSVSYTNCTFEYDINIDANVKGDIKFINCNFDYENCTFSVSNGTYEGDFLIETRIPQKIHISGGTFTRLKIGSWQMDSLSSEIFFDISDKLKGYIDIVNVTSKYLLIRGLMDKDTIMNIENSSFGLINIFRLINNASIRFQKISSTGISQTEFNITDSNLNRMEFFMVNFDSFSQVNIRNSLIMNAIFVNCNLLKKIGAKNGKDIHDGKISILKNEIKTLSEKSEGSKAFNDDLVIQKLRLDLTIEEKTESFSQIEYRKENYKQLKYSFNKTGDKIKEQYFHGLEMEEFMKMNISYWDKIILCVSKLSSNFGQSIKRPLIFNGFIHLLLCVTLFCFFNHLDYYFTLQNINYQVTGDVIKEGAYLFIPLRKFDENSRNIIFFEVLMRINSGLFLYNVIRASRKYYY